MKKMGKKFQLWDFLCDIILASLVSTEKIVKLPSTVRYLETQIEIKNNELVERMQILTLQPWVKF